MKNAASGFQSRLFVKVILGFLIILFVWMSVFLISNQAIMMRNFRVQLQQYEERNQGQGDGAGQNRAVPLREHMLPLFQRATASAIRIATIVSFVIAIVASLLLTRYLVGPVQDMYHAAKRIADGHYSERVKLPEALPVENYDEWQLFALQFNQMAKSLEDVETLRRELIGNVAHEMRTPLTTIKGYMEGLIDGVLEATPENYNKIFKEADRLQHLVADLQELSRVESNAIELDLQPVPVSKIIETNVERTRHIFDDRGISLSVEVPETLRPVLADEERVHQVMINLISNALRYTPEGGAVRLSAREEGDYVRFIVADNGIGIPREHLRHIFDRFYRVDKSRARESGGSGIGLTIAKHLVESHGGEILAESPGEGQGSTFSFTLPVSRLD
ncbi:MAG: hypothetical protein JW750_08895 [Anaerolineaceae bacterium]|nr:hypothetical protein [Anaerolineaceae bacterium]